MTERRGREDGLIEHLIEGQSQQWLLSLNSTGELSNRFQLQVYERMVSNPIQPGRVYDSTQTQST